MNKKYILTENQIRQIFIDGSMNQYKLSDPEAWSNYMESRCPIPAPVRQVSDGEIQALSVQYSDNEDEQMSYRDGANGILDFLRHK